MTTTRTTDTPMPSAAELPALPPAAIRTAVMLGALLLAVGCHASARPAPISSHAAAASSSPVAAAEPAPDTERIAQLPSAWRAPAPSARRRVIVSTSISVFDNIEFVGASAMLAPAATRKLDDLADTLNGNPSILVIEVIAHGQEAPVGQQRWLGEHRAAHIVQQLVARGVDRKRLRASGIAVPARADAGPVFLIRARAGDPSH